MTDIDTPRVVVVGAGAMGSLFGGRLAAGGLEVVLLDVWREHVDAIRLDGLRIVGHGGERRIAVGATTDPADAGVADIVLVQCKALQTVAALSRASPVFGPQTVAISFQNGLGNEEVIAGVIGEDRVLGGLTALGAVIEGPGVVRTFAADLPTTIGEMTGGVSERARRIAAAFTRGGLKTTASPDIRRDMWKKLISNVAFSAISGATRLANRDLVALPELKEVAFGLANEAVQVAIAAGVNLNAEEALDTLRRIIGEGGTAAMKSSLCTDIENERPTEIDVLNGAVVRLGREHGVPTPINQTLVGVVKGLESRYLPPTKAGT